MNEDLNNLTEPGTYYSKNDATTKSLTNCPLTTLGFTMTVNYSTGNDSSYICQTIYGRTTSFLPIRYVRYKSGSNWGEWYSFSDDATVSMTSTNDVLQTAENQTSTQTKFYWLSGTSYNGELPADSYKYGSAIVLKRASNSISVAVFSIGKPIYNSYSNGSWSGWRDFTGASV